MTFLLKYIFDTILYSVMHDIVKICTTVPPPQPPPPHPQSDKWLIYLASDNVNI